MNMFNVLTTAELKEMPLKERFITSMLVEKANINFSRAVIDILVARGQADDIQIKHFQAQKEASWNTYFVVEALYESEYGKLSKEIEKVIDTSAKALAENALIKRNWKKEAV